MDGAEICTLRQLRKIYLECSEMFNWRRMDNIKFTDSVRNEENNQEG